MKKNDFLFVYGTLRRGERADLSTGRSNHAVDYMGRDKVNGMIFNLGSFPGAKIVTGDFDPSLPVIVGDLFWIRNESITAVLDAYEGYPSLYNRVQVPTEGGKTAWIYTYNHEMSRDRLIHSGDWKERVSSLRAA